MPILLFLFGLLQLNQAPLTITVNVSSSVAKGGTIYLAIYENEEQFKAEEPAIGFTEESIAGNATFSVELPTAGRYALAAYHDVNGNEKLDKNLWGIPTEPYGFSILPASKWKAPKFVDISRDFTPQDTLTELTMKRWKEY